MGRGLYGYELWMAQKEAKERAIDAQEEMILLIEEDLTERWRASQIGDPCNVGSLKDYLRCQEVERACREMSAIECCPTEDEMILF